MKLLVINNLAAGYADGAVYDFVRSFLGPHDEALVRCVDETSSFENAVEDAHLFDAVAACGGDGTVATICYLLRNTGIPILPFPAGTANLLAQNLAMPTEPHALALLARNRQTLDFDVGEISLGGTTQGFMMMAGCGYDAAIMNDAKETKKILGTVAYFKAALDNPNPTISKLKVSVDGTQLETQGVGVLMVNFSKIQFDISFTEQNLPRDGMLDVIVLTTQNAWELLPPILGAAIDKTGAAYQNTDALAFHQGSHITVEADPALMVQYDGEPTLLTTPLDIRVLPGAARLIVGDEAFAEFGF